MGKFHLYMKKVFILSLLIGFSAISYLQAYIWPTNAPKLLSGTFGERRAGHFHSGIDIKTWAQSGYDCYAVEDGYVSRIKESPGGYGKVLYLKLDNGQTAVYAHLDKFNGSLEKISYSLKLKENTNLVDKHFLPNEVRVRKGNVIAFTGGSGTRYPHLHFEHRDAEDRLLNPIKQGYEIEDKLPPLPLKIALSPIDAGSEVMGKNTYSVYPLEFFRNNIYLCKDTIQAKGKIQINLQAYDQSSSGNNNGVYQMELYHQGKKRFTKKFDSFTFEETDLILLDRDYRLAAHDLGDFHALYSSDINQHFSAYDSSLTGILDIKPGFQTVVIQVRDAHGNRSSVRFEIFGGEYPDFQFSSHSTDSFFSIHTDSLLRQEKIKTLILKQKNSYGFPIDEKVLIPGDNFLDSNIVMNLRDLDNSILSLEYIDARGYRSYLQLRSHQYSDHVLIEIFSEKILAHEIILAMEKEGYENLDLKRISDYSFITEPVSYADLEGVKGFAVFEKSGTEWLHRKEIHSFISRQDKKTYWMDEDSTLALILPRQAYYQDVFVWFEEIAFSDPVQGGQILSSVYHFYPEDMPSRRGLSAAFRFHNEFPITENIGVYNYDVSKDKWNPLRSHAADPSKPYIDVKGFSGGIISVIRDTENPIIKKSYPGTGGRYRRKDINKQIWVEIDDNLSGFGNGSKLKITIDGEWKVFYYNAVTKVITVDGPGLSRGKHKIEWEIGDMAGNVLTRQIYFTVY